MSSANIRKDSFFEQLGISFIYSKNNNGPSVDPCGTPQVILNISESVLSNQNNKHGAFQSLCFRAIINMEHFRVGVKQLKNNKHEVFILGDMNGDFLKYSTHADTEEYLDMLYLDNFIPIITKPTRITEHSSTLIDHIYTNASTQNIVSGIALVDISDHLPTFSLYTYNTSS